MLGGNRHLNNFVLTTSMNERTVWCMQDTVCMPQSFQSELCVVSPFIYDSAIWFYCKCIPVLFSVVLSITDKIYYVPYTCGAIWLKLSFTFVCIIYSGDGPAVNKIISLAYCSISSDFWQRPLAIHHDWPGNTELKLVHIHFQTLSLWTKRKISCWMILTISNMHYQTLTKRRKFVIHIVETWPLPILYSMDTLTRLSPQLQVTKFIP